MDQRRTPAGPILDVAIEPKGPADKEKLLAALATVAAQDSSFSFSAADAESGHIIVRGTSERHLDLAVDLLRRKFGVELNIGAPQVGYRERISRAVEIDYTHKKQTGGSGQFARVLIRFEPGVAGSGFIFENAVIGGAVRDDCVPGVVKALEASRDNGVLAGFPLIDSRATLIDGAYHEVDSSAATFEIAARAAFRVLKDRHAVELLQPIMAVEVVTPDEFMGGIIGDLNLRRGEVQGTDQRGDAQVITALVPLANMLGYENTMMTITRGRGVFSVRFDHYEPVPRSVDDDPDRFPPAAAMRA